MNDKKKMSQVRSMYLSKLPTSLKAPRQRLSKNRVRRENPQQINSSSEIPLFVRRSIRCTNTEICRVDFRVT